jgi:DNA-directed RNA polymerase subunit omega
MEVCVARITVEDCLKKIPNRFALVNMVARRVRQIREGSDYLVSSPKNEDVVIALREVAAGRVVLKNEKPADES